MSVPLRPPYPIPFPAGAARLHNCSGGGTVFMRRVWIAVWVPALCAQVVPDTYIVELTGRPAAVSAVSRAAMDAPRLAVRAEQARLRPQLERSGARVLASFETVVN